MGRAMSNPFYTMDASDIFTKFDFSEMPSMSHKSSKAQLIFKVCLWEVINDIIENDIEFIIPKTPGKILMLPLSKELFMKTRLHGGMLNVDFLRSNFIGYRLYMIYRTAHKLTFRPIYIARDLDRIDDYTSLGRSYILKGTKMPKDYIDIVASKFPDIDYKTVKRVIEFSWPAFYNLVKLGADFYFYTSKKESFNILVGNLMLGPLDRFEYSVKKMITKVRIRYKRLKIPYNGHHLVSIRLDEYESYMSLPEPRGPLVLRNKVLYRIDDECKLYHHGATYFVVVPMEELNSTRPFYREIEIKDPEFIIRYPLKYDDLKIKSNNYEFIKDKKCKKQ